MWWRLSLLGIMGVASFLLVPMEKFAPVEMDPMLLRSLAVLQPAMLVVAFASLGAWAAPKVGLDAPAVRAWAESRPVGPQLSRQLPSAAIVGVAVAAILLAYVANLRPTEAGAALFRFNPPLASRLLYGGLTEELLMRWCMMSLLVWLAWRVGARPCPAGVTKWVWFLPQCCSQRAISRRYHPCCEIRRAGWWRWCSQQILSRAFYSAGFSGGAASKQR
jgi:hypothetical protein